MVSKHKLLITVWVGKRSLGKLGEEQNPMNDLEQDS